MIHNMLLQNHSRWPVMHSDNFKLLLRRRIEWIFRVSIAYRIWAHWSVRWASVSDCNPIIVFDSAWAARCDRPSKHMQKNDKYTHTKCPKICNTCDICRSVYRSGRYLKESFGCVFFITIIETSLIFYIITMWFNYQ